MKHIKIMIKYYHTFYYIHLYCIIMKIIIQLKIESNNNNFNKSQYIP